jgi:hypothetical protein
MSCRKDWSTDFLSSNFTKTFLTTEYRQHNEMKLFDKERNLFPATQPFVERTLKADAINREIGPLEERYRDLAIQMRETHITINKLVEEKSALLSFLHNPKNMKVEKREYVHKCPGEDCHGFLDTKWFCSLCKITVCKACHEPISENHKCNPDIVESIKLLNRDSKPCPSCHSIIYKISGCNQMWCTNCHTTWDWATGQIDKGRIHNPEYLKFVRENGIIRREHNDNPCGGLPDVADLHYRLSRQNIPKQLRDEISTDLRIVTHVWNIEAPRYMTDDTTDNLDLRIQYMTNKIDEKKFKQLLYQRHKAIAKKKEFYDIFSTYRDVSIDIFGMLMNAKTLTEVMEYNQQYRRLAAQIYSDVVKVSKKYNCSIPSFMTQLTQTHHQKSS